MPPLALLAPHLLASLLLSAPTLPDDLADSTPTPQNLSFAPHSPSTLHFEVGDMRNNRPLSMLHSMGLFHTRSAQIAHPNFLYFSLLFSYAYANNNFPLPFSENASYSDTSLWTAAFSSAWVLFPWLEAYASYEVASSSSLYSDGPDLKPSPIAGQMLGDVHFGAKFAYRLFPSFYAGLDLGLRLFTDNQPMRSMSFAFLPSALFSWNIQEALPRLPLLFHANFGLHIGRNANGSLAQLASYRNVWTTFAWNLNSRHSASLSFALEAPLPYATPFIEYQLTLPFWTQEDNNSPSPLWSKANPQSLSLGAKLTLLPNFSLVLGADIRLKSAPMPGIHPTPPWRFFFGISFSAQPFPHSSTPTPSLPPSAQTPRHAPTPPADSLSPILGSISDVRSQKPIPNAEIDLLAAHLQTPSNGLFQSPPLPPGTYTLEIHAQGYASKTQAVHHNPQITHHPISLSPFIADSLLSLSLKRNSRSINGQAFLRNTPPQNFSLPADASSPPITLPPGLLLLEILPNEGLAKIQKINLSPGQKQSLSIDIEPSPISPLVRLLNQRILFAEPLAFSTHKTELSPLGQTQLRNLVDLLVRNHIRSLRIESHVESQKTEAKAMQLSAQYSQIVIDALVKLGVDAERIEVLNLGDSRPIAPNTVRKGRLLNRRMDFVVLEKWEPIP